VGEEVYGLALQMLGAFTSETVPTRLLSVVPFKPLIASTEEARQQESGVRDASDARVAREC